jgi:hypothetical protein
MKRRTVSGFGVEAKFPSIIKIGGDRGKVESAE